MAGLRRLRRGRRQCGCDGPRRAGWRTLTPTPTLTLTLTLALTLTLTLTLSLTLTLTLTLTPTKARWWRTRRGSSSGARRATPS